MSKLQEPDAFIIWGVAMPGCYSSGHMPATEAELAAQICVCSRQNSDTVPSTFSNIVMFQVIVLLLRVKHVLRRFA